MNTQTNTAAIILAAGASSRMGHPKQLIKWQNKTFIEHTIETAINSNLFPIKVVLGAHKELIEPIIQNYEIDIVLNHDWENGLSTSVKKGIMSLTSDIENVIILLVDQPHVQTELIKKLIIKNEESDADIIIPTYKGRKGNPIAVKSKLFPYIKELKGDRGFRQIINKFSQEYLEWSDDSIFFDIDYEKDLKLLNEKYQNE